jgi:antitoxin component HigA of HigAB toxin-antitoxin module
MTSELKPIRTQGGLQEDLRRGRTLVGHQARNDLEPIIGTRPRVAEVLNRKRDLSIEMIRRLHDHLGISAEVLIRPSRVEEAA